MNKKRLQEIIFGYKTKSGKAFDVVLLLAIIISVILVMLDSDKEIHKEYGSILSLSEWLFTIFFTIEYALRIYCAPDRKKYIFSTMGVIDLLSIIPTYLVGFYAPIGSLIDIRIMRVIRIFRIFKLTPYLRSGHTMQIALRSSRPKIIVFILYISLIVVILGTLMYIIEGQQNGFDNIPKSIYWAVVTLTTVGYGDVVPITTVGKTVAVFIMMLGYAIIAVPTGIVSSELSKSRKDKELLKNQDEILQKDEQQAKQILEKLDRLEKKIEEINKG